MHVYVHKTAYNSSMYSLYVLYILISPYALTLCCHLILAYILAHIHSHSHSHSQPHTLTYTHIHSWQC